MYIIFKFKLKQTAINIDKQYLKLKSKIVFDFKFNIIGIR